MSFQIHRTRAMPASVADSTWLDGAVIFDRRLSAGARATYMVLESLVQEGCHETDAAVLAPYLRASEMRTRRWLDELAAVGVIGESA